MTDEIVYLVVSNGGGMDGMDHTDKGGKVMWAGLSREEIPPHYRNDGWYRVEPKVVDLKNHAYDAVRAMDPLTRLAMIAHGEAGLNYYAQTPKSLRKGR